MLLKLRNLPLATKECITPYPHYKIKKTNFNHVSDVFSLQSDSIYGSVTFVKE
ncbi:hypothetical protein PJXGC_gp12 [Liberibacter phage P-JXGC-3]|nr:hypothetical protein PJXGC_gp12 [Liberibacter phage P-JXGC-3]